MSETTAGGELSAAKRALLEARLRGVKPAANGVPAAAANGAAPIPRRAPAPVPLSFAQERFWFLDRLQPGMSAYNLPAGLRLTGALDVGAVERTLAELVRRHEILRTTFREGDDGAPVQVIAPPGPLALPREDLSPLERDAREAAVRRLVAEDAAEPFDLAAGPLFRPRLLRLAPEEHVLLLSMHHIVSDGWSGSVILREIAVLYEAFREGAPSPLPEPPIQYGDYAAWQRETLRGDAVERQVAYWKERMAGAPALLELPADHPRPSVTTSRGGSVPVIVQPVVLERLRAIGRGEGATLYMVTLAAFAALLGRHAGTDDVVMGAPVAGRGRRELEGLIGLFVNTLLVRVDLSGDPTFRELVRRARETVLGGLGHQDVPFERLVAELAPERSLSHAPLFQVAFQLDDLDDPSAPAEAATLEATRDGIRVQSVAPEVATSKFDLTLQLKASFRGITGSLQFSTDLFRAETARRMARHFVRILEQAGTDGARRLSRFDLLDDGERDRVLAEWNRSDVPLADARPVHARVEALAATAPDAPAVVLGEETRTYAELDARANRLARRLRRQGVGPDVRVAVCLPRGPELVTALLAVLKAGGAYVPLDPDLPPARLGGMAADAGAALLVTRDGLRDRVETDRPVLRIDTDATFVDGEDADPPAVRVDEDNLAYVLYTSGSTGTPKGVAVTHGGLRNLCAWYVDAYGLTAGDRVTQLASPGFDASGFEIWPCLTRGACLDVVPDELRADPPRLRDWLILRRATQSFAPTPVAEALMALEWPGDAPLRWLHAGGDRLQARPRAGSSFRVSNDYGPTECTVVSAWSVVEAEDGSGRAPDIGRPVHNTRCYVLGGGMEPQPAGIPGELCVGGVQVARGYLGRPALTAERFVPDPFGAAGSRLYRTGDRARRREDGVLECLGRLDAQVKIRGFRIEPGEVEALLRAQPGVDACAVVVREDAPGERRLVAYVVGGVDADALRAPLRSRLPDYMVPSAIVPIDALPLTPSGKLDRRALPAPVRPPAASTYVAPRTPTEEALAAIWAEVLRTERAGVEDDFFALGGHSLLATRLLTRIRDALGVDVPLRAVFEAPTPAGLARRVDALLQAPAEDGAPPLVPVPRGGPLPVSFAQQRLWFIHQMDPGSAAYNLPYALRLRGALDGDAMRRALDALVLRHEPLRTVFHTLHGAPVQVIHPPAPLAPQEIDLRGLADEEREARAAQAVREEAARPFDLAAGPLVRVTVLRLGEEETGVLLTLHHVVSDGWSQDVLVRDLSELYGAFAEGRAPDLPELSVQYADFAAWQRRWLSGEVLERQMEYWRRQLAGAPPLLELPTDRPRASSAGSRAEGRAFVLSAETSEGLRGLARREGATLFMVLLAGYAALLSRWSGQDDIVVGTPVAGRNRLEVENLVGFFVNMLALRTDLSADPPFRALVERVREGVLQAHAHQDVPFEKLVDELQPERSLSHPPLFQALFTLTTPPREGLRLGGLEASPMGGAAAQAKFDLSLSLADGAERMAGALVYRADLFDAATVDRLADHLVRLLDQVAADGDLPLSRVELLTPEERRRVLEEWSGGAGEDPRVPIHALFEAQAARTPGAVALVAGEDALTYGALNARANRLARHLARRGVRPEARVGVCLERGPELIVALLAVLKAGGAYVPLDPDDPAERLVRLLADAGVSVLVTDGRTTAGLPLPGALAVVRVDADGAAIAEERGEDAAVPVEPDGLAYVMYTSGSTGAPKGVGVTHRNVARLVRGADYAELGPGETILQAAPVSFDASTFEIWGALLNGGRLVLLPGRVSSLDELARTIADRGITTLWLTAGLFSAFVDERLDALGGVRQLLAGGDVLPGDAVARVRERWPEMRLVNGYGPTENTTFTACYTVPAGWAGASVPIGRPVANTRAYVLDASLRPLPAGLPGELFAGGEGVARGYPGRPALTAERFVPDPYGAPGSRLYRTGDRARWRLDGALEFLGRVDGQVKVRGFRIEPGEVEAALRGADGVRDCAIVAREHGGERRLVAYVVGRADTDALRALLRRTLPEHMVPSAIVPMDALPLTPNGKLHRAALPAPGHASPEEAYVAPRTPAERTMAAIWAEVLRMERVSIHDNFFDVGGHSLLAVRVFARVREAFGVEVPLRALFEHPTLGEFAGALEHAAAPVQPAPEIVVRERVEAVLAGVEEMSEEELDRLLGTLSDEELG